MLPLVCRPTLLAHLLARKGPDTAALVRTTAAVTYLHAHTADNVLPSSGQVGFNFRLLPGREWATRSGSACLPDLVCRCSS